ncbi:MAG: HAD family hydrolase [Eubacterium sp.]|nr:HAD family hydrolase [Eubacterium sp.]
MKKYKNYLFDLYGTLVDISTDEQSKKLWKKLAKIYACYGAEYKAKELKKEFFRMDREERKLLKLESGCDHPEIKLEKVFIRLLCEAPQILSDRSISIRMPENLAVWAELMANTFRTLSRDYLRLFPDTLETLDRLRERGSKVFLLSNAQAIFTIPEICLMRLDEHMDKLYISSDYGVMKPDFRFINKLVQEEGIDISESVMIGNEVRSDVKVAQSCGMDGILLNNYNISPEDIRKEALEHGVREDFVTIEKISMLLD